MLSRLAPVLWTWKLAQKHDWDLQLLGWSILWIPILCTIPPVRIKISTFTRLYSRRKKLTWKSILLGHLHQFIETYIAKSHVDKGGQTSANNWNYCERLELHTSCHASLFLVSFFLHMVRPHLTHRRWSLKTMVPSTCSHILSGKPNVFTNLCPWQKGFIALKEALVDGYILKYSILVSN